MKRIFTSGWFFVAILVALVGCTVALGGKPKFQSEGEHITDAFAQRFQAAVPYPLAQMRDSLERRNLRERLVRFNKPDKIGYVYLIGLNGDFIGYYTIKGKISSVQSQMTTPINLYSCGDHGTPDCEAPSMGDDGSYGPNEGGDDGVFFFTTNNVLVETSMDFIYSDSPLPVSARQINPSKGQKNLSDRG